jgi:uncharacterized membrane protein
MEYVYIFLQIVAIFFIPVLIIKYHNFKLTKWIGTIGTAYFLGILIALTVFLFGLIGINITLNETVGQVGSHLAIAIAIPLLLFSANLKAAKKLSKTVLKSFASLTFSAVIVSSLVFYVYAKNIEYGDVLSGMAIGLYTGGTPNLNAIGNIFIPASNSLKATIISSANLADMMIGAVFYIFLLVLCKPLLSKFLRNRNDDLYVTSSVTMKNTDELELESFKLRPHLMKMIILAFGLALLSAVIGLLIWIVVLKSADGRMMDILVPSLLIGVTVFGQYFILVFSFGLASSIDFTQMQSLFGQTLLLYGAITIGVFIVHSLISKILNIDVDCTIVTLTAGLYGPAFVPAITKQIKNDDLTVPGLITGSIGYAIGTFLGMALVFVYMI